MRELCRAFVCTRTCPRAASHSTAHPLVCTCRFWGLRAIACSVTCSTLLLQRISRGGEGRMQFASAFSAFSSAFSASSALGDSGVLAYRFESATLFGVLEHRFIAASQPAAEDNADLSVLGEQLEFTAAQPQMWRRWGWGWFGDFNRLFLHLASRKHNAFSFDEKVGCSLWQCSCMLCFSFPFHQITLKTNSLFHSVFFQHS